MSTLVRLIPDGRGLADPEDYMNPEVEALLNSMLATTVHRESYTATEIADWILDVRSALTREPVLA